MPSILSLSSLSRLRVAIIGGGISGLAAAHSLAERLPGAEIELFEASDRLGGVLQTVEQDGYLIEQSADNFLVKPPNGVELCQKLGPAVELVGTDESRRRAFVVRDGRMVPIPAGFFLMSPRALGPFVASRALSVVGKLRLLAEPLIPPRINPHPLAREAALDESVASFARRRLGREAFERLVQPLVAGIYTADPEQLSMAATMPQFLEYERTAGSLLRATLGLARSGAHGTSGARYGLFVAPQRGMASMIHALANCLPQVAFHLNTRVEAIVRRAGCWELDARVSQPTFDAVIIALPSYAAARLLAVCDHELSAQLAAIEYAGCAVVSFGFGCDQIGRPLDGFGFVVPRTERRRIIAGSFASHKFAGRAPVGQVLIRVFLGGALQPELLERSDDELRQIAQAELADLLQFSGLPRVVNVARWPRAMPQYHVGHLGRVDRIERLAARHRGLALAGNAYRGVGIPQCIASGEAAAERIADAMR